MPRLSDPRCPSCGADLPIVEGATVARCRYCDNEVMLKHTQHAMPAPTVAPASPAKKVSPLVVIIPMLLVFGAIAGAVVCVVNQVKDTAKEVTTTTTTATTGWNITTNSSSSTKPSAPQKNDEPPKMKTRIRWVANEQDTVARVNTDAFHDLVALAYFPSDDNDTYVIAVDGKTYEQLWKVGPYGNNDVLATSNTKFVVMGDKLVVADHKSMVHVIDLATGKEERSTSLTDRASWICPHPTDADRAWLEVADKNNVSLTVSTGALKPERKRPANCLEWSERNDCTHIGSATCVSADQRAPFRTPEGMHIEAAMRVGKRVVGVGYKRPGTSHSMIAGFGSGGKHLAWKRRVVDTNDTADVTGQPDFFDMTAGRAFVYYEIGRGGHHMIAIDAINGETAWDVELPGKDGFDPDPESIVASSTRVFVTSGQVVYVFDQRDGTLLGQVGDRW